MVNGTWVKEKRLSELKTELASIDRKLHLSLVPERKEEPAEQVNQKQEATKGSESTLRLKDIHLPRGIL